MWGQGQLPFYIPLHRLVDYPQINIIYGEIICQLRKAQNIITMGTK